MQEEFKKELRKLIDERYKQDPQNDVLTEQFWNKVVSILTINLEDTINYLDNIDARDLYFVSEVFDDIYNHFKSKELLDCFIRNSNRTNVDCSCEIERCLNN